MKPNEILATLDADIADTERRLAQLQLVRTNMAALYGEVPASAPPTRKTAAAPATTRRPATDTVDDPDGARVLKFLEKQRAPVSQGTVVEATKLSAYLVKKAIDALVEAGTAARLGEGRGLRVGTPAVMAAASKEEL